MTKQLTQAQVVELLRDLVMRKGTQRDAAAEIGISGVHLGRILAGKEPPGPAVLQYFDIERRTVYEKK